MWGYALPSLRSTVISWWGDLPAHMNKKHSHRASKTAGILPNLGALDGKHVAIKRPVDSGSIFYNYTGFYSIVLMALVDAKYNFVWIYVGYETSDAQLFNSWTKTTSWIWNPWSASPRDTPYFFVADETFAMTTWLMKPYARRAMARQERIYNYRLFRARRWWRMLSAFLPIGKLHLSVSWEVD